MTITTAPRETVTAPTIFVGVVEWGSSDGDREPVVFASADSDGAQGALAGFLAAEFAAHPHCFYDDSAAFMDSPREWAYEPPFGPLTADRWLAGLRTATTAPWASVIETPLLTRVDRPR